MRIAGSTVELQSRYAYSETQQVQESLRVWAGDDPARAAPAPAGDRLEISAEARSALSQRAASTVSQPGAGQAGQPVDSEDQLRILVLREFLGLAVRVAGALPASARGDTPSDAPSEGAQAPAAGPQQAAQPERAGWGAVYRREESYVETEQLQVRAGGIIRTADGREIRFDLELNMSRSFAEHSQVTVRAGDAARRVDPLVINFDGTLADFSDRTFRFDLDADGTPEQLAALRSGSGMLALDRDGNGKIDSGRELFGPASGDGFAELARLDSDGSGWIDENDPVFSKLRIWTKDQEGRDRLLALGQVGIGAIYLGAVQGQFTYKGAQNRPLASQQQVGLFVRENGTVGSVQQLDLYV